MESGVLIASTSIYELMSSLLTIQNLPPYGVIIPLWPWVLWNLWKARNHLCFENRKFSAIEIVTKAIRDAMEWQKTQLVDNPQSADNVHRRQLLPALPSSATPKCYVDAAWDARTEACGLGGVFSGPPSFDRLPHLSESRTLVSSALMAEALAVRLAVMKTAFSNMKSLVILSDSLSLITLLKGKDSRPELFGILFDIYHFIPYFDAISFCYIPRFQNTEADGVAKSALVSVIASFSISGV